MDRLPATLMVLLATSVALAADPYDELRIKREQVFEFAQKPEVTRKGDIVTIAFESKGFCDCTVAIEDARGRIVRHLASGVLGKNAPPPFERNSKKQTLVWDGKDDLGVYIDDKDSITIRVSLGLKPRFERTLFWSPKRHTQGNFISFHVLPAAAPEGVYVYTGDFGEHVKLFDHDGNYVRSVYPFPRNKLTEVKGLKWMTFPPDNEKFPGKWNAGQNSLLTTFISDNGKDKRWPGGTIYKSSVPVLNNKSTALAVHKNRIALAGFRLHRMTTAGQTPDITLDGPKTAVKRPWQHNKAESKSNMSVPPRSAALSPDGKWLYMTGYLAYSNQFLSRKWLHGVARTRFTGAEAPGEVECWIGKMAESGKDNMHFNVPTSVAVDAKGRVYVSDYMNDRIQVFSEEGRHQKTISIKKPVRIVLHPKTGDIYVCSWLLGLLQKTRVPATLTQLGPFEAPQVKGTYELPLKDYKKNVTGGNMYVHQWRRAQKGIDYRVEVDFYTDPPRVWIAQFAIRNWTPENLGSLQATRFSDNIEIYEFKAGKLELKRSFSDDVKKTVVREAPPKYARQRLYFDHKNERFYIGEPSDGRHSSKRISELISVDPATGAVRFVKLPFQAEDLGFDMQGRAYLRTYSHLVRYDASPRGKWREIPYDYGEEVRQEVYGFRGAKNVTSCIIFPGTAYSSSQVGGMGVSPDGTVALEVQWGGKDKVQHRKGAKTLSAKKTYSPRLYPGRRATNEIRMFDKHGKCITMDALPGVSYCQGVQVDRGGNLYAQSDYVRVYGKKRFINPYSCTLMKVKPNKARILVTRATPVKLDSKQYPKRPKDVHAGWVEGADWLYGGVGLSGVMRFDVGDTTMNCHCESNARFALDYYARSFVSESDRYRIAVIDTNGNLITRIGKYGNVDDGVPLVKDGGPPNTRSIGGDEVAIMHCLQMTTHTDKRLFLADWGNYRIVSVKLGYHKQARIALKDVPDQGE